MSKPHLENVKTSANTRRFAGSHGHRNKASRKRGSLHLKRSRIQRTFSVPARTLVTGRLLLVAGSQRSKFADDITAVQGVNTRCSRALPSRRSAAPSIAIPRGESRHAGPRRPTDFVGLTARAALRWIHAKSGAVPPVAQR